MFDTKKMPYRVESDGKPRYLFCDNYIEQLNLDISAINNVLYMEQQKVSQILNPFIPSLNCDPNANSNGPINYTFLWLNDKTPTGKTPKYVYTVYFNTFIGDYSKDGTNNDTFGRIYYLQNGEIGKVRIIMWRNRKLSVVHLKKQNDELVISKVENK